MANLLLSAAIAIMGLLYIFITHLLIFKLIPMVLILIYAYLQRPTKKQRSYFIWTSLGLFFCMLGDGLLHWFMIGLCAFLIGHLFYIGAFITRWTFSWIRAATLIPIIVYASYMAYQIRHAIIDHGNPDLVIPVLIYLVIISLMGWFAIMTSNGWAMIGSLLFITSDSILAWNMFVSHVAYSGILIMCTYYAAQFLIASSIRSNRFRKRI